MWLLSPGEVGSVNSPEIAKETSKCTLGSGQHLAGRPSANVANQTGGLAGTGLEALCMPQLFSGAETLAEGCGGGVGGEAL